MDTSDNECEERPVKGQKMVYQPTREEWDDQIICVRVEYSGNGVHSVSEASARRELTRGPRNRKRNWNKKFP